MTDTHTDMALGAFGFCELEERILTGDGAREALDECVSNLIRLENDLQQLQSTSLAPADAEAARLLSLAIQASHKVLTSIPQPA